MAIIDSPDSPLLWEESQIITGGMVNHAEPHLLTPDQAVRLLNIQTTVSGRRQKRTGVLPMGTGPANPLSPNSLHEFLAATAGIQHLVGQWGSELYSSSGDDTWTRRASSFSLADTVYFAAQGRTTDALPGLFFASCVGVTDNASLPYSHLFSLNSAWGASPVSEIRPRTLAWFQGRLWAYNSCMTNHGQSWLTWSAPLRGNDFDHGEGFSVDPDTADAGVCIVPSRDNTPRLFLFNERSVYQLDIYWTSDGYYPTTANALDFTKSSLRPIVISSGCVAPRGALWVPGQSGADILFLSREGIRLLSRSLTDAQGGTPLPLSYRIQPTIDRINWAMADRSCAAYWDGKAYFAVPVDGAVHPNLIIAYDVSRDQFSELDLNVRAWTPAKLSNARSFYFLSGTSGTETELSSPATGATYGYHVYEWGSGTADPFKSPINFIEETRAFSFDQGGAPGTGLRYRKKWNYLDLAVQSAATDATLSIEYRVDDDTAWSRLNNILISPSDDCPYLPVQLPFSFGSGKVVRKTMLMRDVRPGHKIQFRLSDDSSFALFKIISLTLHANPMNPKFADY